MQGPLLVIEDSEEDIAVLRHILTGVGFTRPIVHLAGAEEALESLSKAELRPALILLDLNLPGLDGRGFLVEIKRVERLKSIPVIILSTSSAASDVEFCFQHGVAGYIMKLMDLPEQARVMRAFVDYWFASNVLPPSSSLP